MLTTETAIPDVSNETTTVGDFTLNMKHDRSDTLSSNSDRPDKISHMKNNSRGRWK
jgi:hypothetical protein